MGNLRPALNNLLTARGLAINAALGACAALGLAPFGLWPLTLIAYAAFFWRHSSLVNAGAGFRQSLAFGAGWFALALSWIVEPFLVEPEIYGWMAPFAIVLMALGGALFVAIPIYFAHRFCPSAGGRIWGGAAALVISEWLRGWIFTGFPWALSGHIWIDTPVAQVAAWGGAVGLSALTVGISSLILMPFIVRPVPRHPIVLAATIAMLSVGVPYAAGVVRQSQPLPSDTTFALRIVQPNAEQHLKWDPDWNTVFFERLLDLSARPGPRDLVIWPETAVNFLLNDAEPVLPLLAQKSAAPLITGIQRRDGERYFNSLALLGAQGNVVATYDKFHLVPFGEYIPWGDFLAQFGVDAFAAQRGNGYSAGPGPRVLQPEGVPSFQPLICYEAIFPQHLRNLTSRPEWLLQLTNDGWFGKVSGPFQHLAQARLRAIETGLPLVRAANTGISALVDARGQILAQLNLGEVGVIDAALPGALPQTLWITLGPAPTVIAALLTFLAAAVLSRRRRDDLMPRALQS